MRIKQTLLGALILFFALSGHSQKGKDGDVTISSNSIVNEFTILTSDESAGSTTISVASSSLNDNGRFSGNLEAGDLIMLVQIQGITYNGGTNWNTTFGTPADPSWGGVDQYQNCGNNEFAEVKSVPNGTTIELRCGLTNAYTTADKVQVIRVPRYLSLTISPAGTISTEEWDGNTGGILSLEVENDLTVNGSIDATGTGFRGGQSAISGYYNGAGQYAAGVDANEGAAKGEGLLGYEDEYLPLAAKYCRGAAANAGGGGNSHNAGGGGGANAGNVSNWMDGCGVPDPAYNSAWALESPSIAGNNASGGGRGGYSISTNNENALTTAPGNGSWGSDNHSQKGGLGGRPLDYSTGKIFLAGGGGAGHINDASSTGGSGGDGGGIIYLLNYGNVSGSGSIVSNGMDGEDLTYTGSLGFGQTKGNDAAGGAGAGGTIIINSNGTVSGVSLNANGGNGGNQDIGFGFPASEEEAEGPGGGGGGGYIAISSGSPTRTANGGTSGTTNSPAMTEFPPNGATNGGTGLPTETISNFYLSGINDTICTNNTGNPTVTVNGSAPGGLSIMWYDAEVNGNFIGFGPSFTSATNLTSDTTFYVGTCSNTYLIPVSVIIGTSFTYDDGSVSLSDENCGQGDGAISGITVSGGAAPMIYEWNGVVEPSLDISGLSADNYSLVVTDNNGCTASVGTYTIDNVSTMAVNETSLTITDENCGLGNGGIANITVSGGTGPYNYDWNGVSTVGADTIGLNGGSYSLTITDAINCSVTSGPHTVNNIAGPAINSAGISINNESCSNIDGGISGITVSGGNTPYSFEWNGIAATSQDTSNLSAGNYTLQVTDADGCVTQDGPHTVINNAGPTIDSTSYAIVNETCGNTNGEITGITTSGGNLPLSYSWNGISTSTIDTVNIGAGNYSLVVTDALGCSISTGEYIVGNVGLTVDTSAYTLVNDACSQGIGSISGITVTGGNSPYTYEWNGVETTSADTASLDGGSYSLLITDAVSCTFTAGPFLIDNIDAPSIDTTSIIITNESCSESNGSITGITTSGGNGNVTYQWDAGSSALDISNMVEGDYTLTVSDDLGCTSTMGPISLTNTSVPVINSSAITLTDENCSDGTGSISGITVSGGAPTYAYTWNGVITSSADTASLNAGSYTLIVTDLNGCSATLNGVEILNGGIPTADFTASSVSLDIDEELILTDNSSSDATAFFWDFGNGETSTDQNTSVIFTSEGTYTVCLEVTSTGTCIDSTCKNITVIEEVNSAIGVPLAFSPNSDNHNDVLYVRGQGIQSFTFILYNRYGEKVFETNDMSVGWDGIFRNKEENTGVFVYYLEYKLMDGNIESSKGNITLVR